MSCYGRTECTVMKYSKCTRMLLSGSFNSHIFPPKSLFGYQRLQVWTPKLNLSLPFGPQRQNLPNSLLEALRAESNVLTTLHYTATFWRTPRNPICPPATCPFIFNSINLVLYSLRLPTRSLVCVSVWFLLFVFHWRTTSSLSPSSRGLADLSGNHEIGTLSWVTKGAAIES